MKFLVSLVVVLFACVAYGQDMAPIQGYQPVVVQQNCPPNPGNSLPFNTWTGGMTETWTNTQIHRIEPNGMYPGGMYPQVGVYPGYAQPAYAAPACGQVYTPPCAYQQRPCCQQYQQPCYYQQPRQQSWYPGYYMGF